MPGDSYLRRKNRILFFLVVALIFNHSLKYRSKTITITMIRQGSLVLKFEGAQMNS